MKTNMKFILVAIIAFTSFVSTSCSSDDDSTPAPAPQTIAQIAQGNANLSILVEALSKADLVTTLNSAGTYTVFAPDNASFTAAGITSAFIAAQTTPDQIAALRNVLLNHVLATKFTAAQLTTGYKKTLATPAVPAGDASGKIDMFVSNNADGVILNSASEVSTPNITASNGIIHVVDAVISLPSIVTFVGSDPNLSSLYTAVTRLDQAPAGFVGLLSGEASSPFTVFAPTNAAFTTYTGEAGNAASDLTGANLTKILKYHVVAGQNYKSTTLVATTDPILTYLDPQTISIVTELSTGTKIKDQNNRLTAFSTVVDVQANNGIIHQITNVLKPNL